MPMFHVTESKALPNVPKADGGSSMKCRSKSNCAKAILVLIFRFSRSQVN